ncbi:MAG: hypothetical protein R6V85_02360 [Polyangia bacterium]
MTIFSFRTVCAGTLLVLALTPIGSCGGGSGPADRGSVAAGDSPESSDPRDEKAEQARKYCEHSIARSEVQPPDRLSRKAIMACLTALRPEIGECGQGVPRELILKIIVNKDGTVRSTFPVGEGADCPEAACVQKVVSEAEFPRFKGSAQQVIEKYPFELGE